MITDEQVRTVLKVFYPRAYAPCDEEIELMRKALEAYEASKWVKFDVDDESTYPTKKQSSNGLIVRLDGWITPLEATFNAEQDPMFEIGSFYNEVYGSYDGADDLITHWQALPEFKE